jgi:predicted Rdx family selenoprotein
VSEKVRVEVRYGAHGQGPVAARVAEELLDLAAASISTLELVPVPEGSALQVLVETDVLFDSAVEGRAPEAGEVASRWRARQLPLS